MKAKINKESLKIVVSLAAIAFVAALLLAVVNYFTAVDEAEELKKAVAEAYPDSELTELDTSGFTALTGTSLEGAFRAADGAYIFLVHVSKANRIGYSADGVSLITVISEGTIVKVEGYSHSETPGLGANAFKTDYLSQYSGVKVSDIFIPEDNSLGIPDTGSAFTPTRVTSATYTSNAVFASVKGAVAAYNYFAEVEADE